MKNRSIIPMFGLILLVATTALAQAPGGPRRGGGGRGFPPDGRGGPPGRGGTERIADDMSFSSLQQGMEVRSALVAYDQSIRQQILQARSVLLEKMKGILTDAQFSQFKDELEQIPVVGPVPPQARGIATTDLVDRLASFDKNQDGKITKDELPERMLNLLSEGDTNHDDALDKAEIQNLAGRAGVNDQPPGRGGGRGRRGGPPDGF